MVPAAGAEIGGSVLSDSSDNKHWRRGYVSGAFDMFHIGHLNLIRRAREHCDYLIVGVLTDEIVAELKQRWPVIPLTERMEIIRALKYVDETDVTTRPLMNKLAAWEKYRFDAMFSGDDHASDGWAADEEALNLCGAVLVFFPYTKEVSTTRLQEITLPPKAVDADKARKTEGFRHIFPFDKVNRGERVVIYGTGDVGAQYARQLAPLDFCTIVAFADTYARSGDRFEGKSCLTPEEVLARESEFDRVIIASTNFHAQILGRLRTLGLPPERVV